MNISLRNPFRRIVSITPSGPILIGTYSGDGTCSASVTSGDIRAIASTPSLQITDATQTYVGNTVSYPYVGRQFFFNGNLKDNATPVGTTVTLYFTFDFNSASNIRGLTRVIRLPLTTAPVTWQRDHAYIAGTVVKGIADPSRTFVCTVAGTSTTLSEPLWVTNGGATIDNTVTWQSTAWLPGHSYPIGSLINTLASPTKFFISTRSGVSGDAPPAWPSSGSVIDNTVQWSDIQTKLRFNDSYTVSSHQLFATLTKTPSGWVVS
ncbi:MAG: hypothetical protein HQL64_03305 [Magnetococcales bacterium]|nr:hypothetical protein [Magnetococcales bacterium]